MKALSALQIQLCDIQGRLFELALQKGYDCPAFIRAFMESEVAARLDESYDRLQWAGEEYILAELNDTVGGLPCAGQTYGKEAMFWTGFTYRYWNYLTGEKSKAIYAQADAQTMNESYPGFHTLDVALAIDDLKELYRQKNM